MKQFVSYLVLLTLVLVTVPREWVHDCEHSYAHHDDVDHESGSEMSQDDCFACEYDLDYMECLEVALPAFSSKPINDLVLSKIESPNLEVDGEDHRRGPPAIG